MMDFFQITTFVIFFRNNSNHNLHITYYLCTYWKSSIICLDTFEIELLRLRFCPRWLRYGSKTIWLSIDYKDKVELNTSLLTQCQYHKDCQNFEIRFSTFIFKE